MGPIHILHVSNGSYSSIGLTIVDPSLLLDLRWFDMTICVVVITLLSLLKWMMKPECTENRKLNKADWTLFENLCLKNILAKEIEKQSDPIRKFAKNCKPKILTSSKRMKKETRFTEYCKQAMKARKKAARLFKKTPTLLNLNNFRIARAKARRTINQNKLKSWKNYVSNLRCIPL